MSWYSFSVLATVCLWLRTICTNKEGNNTITELTDYTWCLSIYIKFWTSGKTQMCYFDTSSPHCRRSPQNNYMLQHTSSQNWKNRAATPLSILACFSSGFLLRRLKVQYDAWLGVFLVNTALSSLLAVSLSGYCHVQQ